MVVRAKVSFAGAFSMHKGEVKECSDKAILQDLLQADYIEAAEENKPKKAVEKSESKRNNSAKRS
ncbi:hypothetical protein [Anaerosacchariphilus polymeriproducens]|uniref:Uncharacterized protein n=1 Tax=Anaerosacchariphilus polymeriproducens TaxID=1812858 RepID=A0A371AT64_9FIRM|nr:hypothetical protein [Anaerosacchariphilus polymeriproducens]RDU22764.1 hypothetical protein DWV06_13425 [Anaerosacchariphilus polymeriproducens]